MSSAVPSLRPRGHPPTQTLSKRPEQQAGKAVPQSKPGSRSYHQEVAPKPGSADSEPPYQLRQPPPLPRPSAMYMRIANDPDLRVLKPLADVPLYLTAAQRTRRALVAEPRSQPPLLILDLNGTLVWRAKNRRWKSANQRPSRRAYLSTFLEYIFSSDVVHGQRRRRWEVMLWSSAQPRNVESMARWAGFDLPERPAPGQSGSSLSVDDLANVMGRMSLQSQPARRPLAVWTRDNMDLPRVEYNQRVQTFKNLDKVWQTLRWTDPETGEELAWGPENTLLVDDSEVKAAMQPFNRVPISEYKGGHDDELLRLVEILDGISRVSNFAALLKNRTQDELGFKHHYCVVKAREICQELGIDIDKGRHTKQDFSKPPEQETRNDVEAM